MENNITKYGFKIIKKEFKCKGCSETFVAEQKLTKSGKIVGGKAKTRCSKCKSKYMKEYKRKK